MFQQDSRLFQIIEGDVPLSRRNIAHIQPLPSLQLTKKEILFHTLHFLVTMGFAFPI